MIKRVHILTITLALFLPAIPCVVQLAAGGYRPYFSPPRFCSGRNFHITYWTFLLPAAIIFAVTIFAMVLVLGVIFKVHIY